MQAVVSKITQETSLVRTLHLELEEAIQFKPGQFITIIHTIEEEGKPVVIRRAYSISHWQTTHPTKEVSITFNEVKEGKLTPYLYNVPVGETLTIEGPYGNFVLDEHEHPILFLAAGTGITPLMCMLEQCVDKKKKTSLLYSVKQSSQIVFHKELNAFVEQGMLAFRPTVTRDDNEWDGRKGRIDAALVKEVLEEDAHCYICGVKEFVDCMIDVLKEVGVQDDKIHTERW